MASSASKSFRVLSINPSTRGFGFAIFEGKDSLIDWGVKSVRKDKTANSLVKIGRLASLYLPQMIILEDHGSSWARRAGWAKDSVPKIQQMAAEINIESRCFSRKEMKRAFASSNASTKYQMATVIAKLFPELEPRLPAVRKPWMSEDYRMGIFDAVALGVTFFAKRRGANRFSRPIG